jgi:hypothetical protein
MQLHWWQSGFGSRAGQADPGGRLVIAALELLAHQDHRCIQVTGPLSVKPAKLFGFGYVQGGSRLEKRRFLVARAAAIEHLIPTALKADSTGIPVIFVS